MAAFQRRVDLTPAIRFEFELGLSFSSTWIAFKLCQGGEINDVDLGIRPEHFKEGGETRSSGREIHVPRKGLSCGSALGLDSSIMTMTDSHWHSSTR